MTKSKIVPGMMFIQCKYLKVHDVISYSIGIIIDVIDDIVYYHYFYSNNNHLLINAEYYSLAYEVFLNFFKDEKFFWLDDIYEH